MTIEHDKPDAERVAAQRLKIQRLRPQSKERLWEERVLAAMENNSLMLELGHVLESPPVRDAARQPASISAVADIGRLLLGPVMPPRHKR